MLYIANSFDVVFRGMQSNHAKFESTVLINPLDGIGASREMKVVVKARKDIKKLSRITAIDLFPYVDEKLVKNGAISFGRNDTVLVYDEDASSDGKWYLFHRSV